MWEEEEESRRESEASLFIPVRANRTGNRTWRNRTSRAARIRAASKEVETTDERKERESAKRGAADVPRPQYLPARPYRVPKRNTKELVKLVSHYALETEDCELENSTN